MEGGNHPLIQIEDIYGQHKKLKWDLPSEWAGLLIYQVILWDPETEAEAEAGAQAGTPGTSASP